MASLSLQHLMKVYEGKVCAVDDFNIDIKDGEFIVLVGPSGCGKSTTLRMIAGLEGISSGKLMIGDEDCTMKAAKDRDIAMVFQNYALYASQTVYQNMGPSSSGVRRGPASRISWWSVAYLMEPIGDSESNRVEAEGKTA